MERGRTRYGRSSGLFREGVAVIEDEGVDEDGCVFGKVKFRSRTFGLADELMAKGVAKAINNKGKDATIMFHEDSPMLEDGEKS